MAIQDKSTEKREPAKASKAKTAPIPESTSLRQRVEASAASLLRRISGESRASGAADELEKLQEFAFKDKATGMFNRAGLLTCANWSQPESVLILAIGMNNLELVSATFGRRTEEQIMRSIANRLRVTCPVSCLIARGNSSEIFLVQKGLDKANHEGFIKQVRDAFTVPFKTESDEWVIHASVGVVVLECKGSELESQGLGPATLALLTAKDKGISQRIDFDEAMSAQVASKARLARELKTAIAQQELILFFQPIVDLNTKQLRGLEALVRWPHRDRGLVGPAEFMAMAHDSGLIVELGAWALRQTCHEIAKAMELIRLPDEFSVHVNVSALQLMQADFPKTVSDALERSGMEKKTLTLEIDESLLTREDPAIIKNLAALKEMNIDLAVDDFGTGFSSLTYLHRFPFETFKLDRSVVLLAEKDKHSRAVLRAVIDVVANIGVNCVAVGIETPAQARLVRSLGCNYAQGYLFGRPAPLLQALSSRTDLLMSKNEPVTLPLIV